LRPKFKFKSQSQINIWDVDIGLVFCRNNGWIMEGQVTHSTKMGADSLAENTPNALKNFSPKCPPKPKSLKFRKKALWVSVVRGPYFWTLHCKSCKSMVSYQSALIYVYSILLMKWISSHKFGLRKALPQIEFFHVLWLHLRHEKKIYHKIDSQVKGFMPVWILSC
jgi:hypothetical protein